MDAGQALNTEQELNAEQELVAEIEASAERLAAREASVPEAVASVPKTEVSVPETEVPPDLPIAEKAEAIAHAVAGHPITLVVGATGSGKSTQLAKICLRAGRGAGAMIGHTQPRRIAARSVAARIAAELGAGLGQLVGYQVRFRRHTAPNTRVKLMTDGILLAEIQSDRDLLAYDTLIIDEAHERTLNVDFVLGYLRQLVLRRPDLRVVVASATLEVEKLRAFFNQAPVIEVEGRTYPIEIRYRPGEEGDDVPEKVAGALEELRGEPGDVLVFLSGEREIRETEARVRRLGLPDTELFPLHARMSAAHQQALFAAHDRRRIVLATNVAETSLTVPGIRFVIDAGTARVSRYAHRTGVQRLPVEPIARASADQRAGRCGRTGPGVCIRLYDETGFAARPAHPEPEIQRADLAAVLLRMLSLGMQDVERFPFIDPPDRRHVNDGLRLLRELGAVDAGGDLTKIGRRLARLPLDPRIGRMLLEAHTLGCAADVLVIASFLSVPDPRERSPERRAQAQIAHARFTDARSDFLGIVNLWRRFRSVANEPGESMRRFCRRYSLSPSRMRDWLDVHGQIRDVCRELGIRPRGLGASSGRIHRTLLTGLLRCVGARTPEGEYAGLRGTTFRLASGSVLHPGVAPWIVAAEVVETERAYAFVAGRVRAEWVEKAAGDLVRRTHFDAHWDARRAEPMVFEQVALYGLTLIARRRVRFAPVSREGAREVFVRSGLVENGYVCAHSFAERNGQELARLRTVEHKLRSPGAMVTDDAIFAFYDARIPPHIVDGRSFEEWFSGLDGDAARGLELRREDIAPGVLLAGEAAFPDMLRVDDQAFELAYRFAPGEDDDGLTVTIPLDVLVDLDPGRFEWLVPGMLDDKVLALLRALPKSLRRAVMPLAGVAREFIAGAGAGDGSLHEALARFLDRTRGVSVPRDAWSPARLRRVLPAHLHMRFEIADRNGAVLGRGRRLDEIERRLVGRPNRERGVASKRSERGYAKWTFGAVPIEVEDRADGGSGAVFEAENRAGGGSGVVFEAEGRAGGGSGVVFEAEGRAGGGSGVVFEAEGRAGGGSGVDFEAEGRAGNASGVVFPALRDIGSGVVVEYFQARAAAERSHRGGLVRLFSLAMRREARECLRVLPGIDELCLLYAMIASPPDWVDTPLAHAGRPAPGTWAEARHDLVERAVARVFVAAAGAIRERSRFEAALVAGRSEFAGGLAAAVDGGLSILRAARAVRQLIDAPDLYAPPESLADARRQLDGLVHHGFLAATAVEAFASLPRYLEALRVRLEKLRRGGANDARRLAEILPLQQRFESKARNAAARGRRDPELARHRWLLEEYRVSVFAQELGTAFSVSRKKLDEQWSRVAAL